jgi:DNA invertase Pin-like site-specific DNA recombinase
MRGCDIGDLQKGEDQVEHGISCGRGGLSVQSTRRRRRVCAADMPNANQLTVGIMAVVAEDEAKRISERTKAALQAAKARGKKLGGFRGAMPTARMSKLSAKALHARATAQAADLAPIVKELQAAGKTSLRAIAQGLNEQGIPTTRGGEWSSPQVMRILERLDPFRCEEEAPAQA